MTVSTGQTSQTKAATAQPPTPRMTLASITRGRREGPYRLLIHGVDGVGKSTFGANAPSAVFVGPEDGTGHLDVARFPVPTCWADILEALRTLAKDSGGFGTVVLDSVDWVEPLIWRHVCEAAHVASIEDVGGGYGKGYVAALDQWRVLLGAFEYLQRERRLHVVLIAHSFIKTFRNPEGEDFERYVLKLNEKAAALLREWSHGVYFANYETFAVKDRAKRVRGISTGARLLYTQRAAAYDAKDRYGLPEHIPLDWAEFDAAAQTGRVAEPVVLRAEIERKAKQAGGEIGKKAIDALGRAGDDVTRLAQLNSWINAKIGDVAEKEKEN